VHDPSTVAFDVKVPIPRLTSWGKPPAGHRRFTIQRRRYHPIEEHMQHYLNKPMSPWYRPSAYYVWVGSKQLKMRTFATVWHEEPGGADSGEVCSHWKRDKKTGNKIAEVLPERYEDGQRKLSYYIDNSWRWHVHHWRLQFPWLQHIRTYLFQKCAWCGGPSRKKDWVNCTYQWDGAGPKHFWESSPDLYHGDCMTPEHAWRSCSCEFPMLPVRGTTPDGDTIRADYGRCETCGRSFGWGTTPEQQAVYAYIRETTPRNTRMTPEVREQVHLRWEIIRNLKESSG
jgi:hypothetical protein